MGKVKESMHTAPCMFCGQMVQFMADDLLPETEAQELAAMHCSCAEALEYKKEKNRKENAYYGYCYGDLSSCYFCIRQIMGIFIYNKQCYVQGNRSQKGEDEPPMLRI